MFLLVPAHLVCPRQNLVSCKMVVCICGRDAIMMRYRVIIILLLDVCVFIQFVCVVTISYLSICAYYTVFKMRIFNYYVVVGNHHTDENSLIFCGMWVFF